MRDVPDLLKTTMCIEWKHGRCYDVTCRYAHGATELRATSGVFKTQQCTWFANGNCKHGNRCRHAHGESDARLLQASDRAKGQLVYAI